ncbi:hypothetical protein [Chryseobacterium nepalense]|uniref:hypothetical protein n=1 Tax=Chryseobacterium nepalense TaxID=1854498 RepID=UPI002DFFE285|nr:hypothetical protein [Chryseobacterium nepalense]
MSKTAISSDEFVELLKNPTADILTKELFPNIIFKNYIIEGKALYFDQKIDIKCTLTFKNCEFEIEDYIYLLNCKFLKTVTFSKCKIKNGIIIKNALFESNLYINNNEIEDIQFWDTRFKDIILDNNNSQNYNFYRVNYENLNIANNLNELTILYSNSTSGNVYINDININNINIFGNLKDGRLELINIKCNNFLFSKFINNGFVHLANVTPEIVDKNNGYFQINNSNLQKAEFFRIDFEKYNELIIIDSFISECLFINCTWRQNVRALKRNGNSNPNNSLINNRKLALSEYASIKESYRQLKISMYNLNDKIQESKFHKYELDYHSKTIKWSSPLKNEFWDKIILNLSSLLSDYGQSFIKPLLYLLLGHYVLFSTAIALNGFNDLQISIFDPTWNGLMIAFEKFFIYINPFRKTDTSFSGYLIILDILMRIWSSYMIYNIVRATRRFIN